MSASPIDEMIESGGRELLETGDAVAAEVWASSLLAMFEESRRQARLDGKEAPPFLEILLHRCRQRGDLRSAAVASALAAVVPSSEEELAASLAAGLRGRAGHAPSWLERTGSAVPTRGWLATDVFGDQDSLIVSFQQDGQPVEHALVVLVDHNLGGQAKDAWLAPDADDVVAAWRSGADAHLEIDEAPLEEALVRLRDAMAASDLWNGDTELRSEDFARHRALVWARLRRCGLDERAPGQIEIPQGDQDNLASEFMASPHGTELIGRWPGIDVELLVHYVVGLRCDYEGRPLRWSPIVVSHLLSDLAPRKILLEAEQAAALPAVVSEFIRFSAERTGLDQQFVNETLAAVGEVEADFLDRIGDTAAAGPAKAVLQLLRDRGVDLEDADAIRQALEDLGPVKLPAEPHKTKREVATAPAAVVSAAQSSVMLARFGSLASFYGGGRKLTQTGRPTLADARELVSLLGTDDRLDERVHDQTFKTRSAAELRELTFTVRWAIEAGALRKEHGKLLPTSSWAKLESRPLERWVKGAEALLRLGPLATFQSDNRYRPPDEVLDDLAPGILHQLLGRSVPYEEVLDWVCDRAEESYEWLSPYMQAREHRRATFSWDLDRLATIFGWASVMERVGAKAVPDTYEPSRERLIGGALRLTPVGRWWLG